MKILGTTESLAQCIRMCTDPASPQRMLRNLEFHYGPLLFHDQNVYYDPQEEEPKHGKSAEE